MKAAHWYRQQRVPQSPRWGDVRPFSAEVFVGDGVVLEVSMAQERNISSRMEAGRWAFFGACIHHRREIPPRRISGARSPVIRVPRQPTG